MNPEYAQKPAPEPLLGAWIKWTMDFWEAMAQLGPRLSRGPEAAASTLPTPETGESWTAALTLWQAFFSLLSEPGIVEAVFRGIKAPTEVILKMAQAGWGAYFHLYQQWLGGEEKAAGPAEAYGFENLDQDIFKICTEIYENDFRQLLNCPQVGLTRLSQERINRAMAKFGQFQAAMAEFIYLLFLPVKKSLRAMQEGRQNGPESRNGTDFKEYYKTWLKLLEGQYMTLFKSPEYSRTMSHTLNALEDFTLAKQELLADALTALPVASQRDMDELYREIYLLKKQVRELSRRLDRFEAAD